MDTDERSGLPDAVPPGGDHVMDPLEQERGPSPLIVGVFVLLVLIVAAAVVLWITVIRQPAHPQPKLAYPAIGTAYAGEKLFGLQNVRGVVHSAYAYEAGLLGSTPVDDIDYLLPYAAQEEVRLPGFSSDMHIPRGSFYIGGSGIASCWVIASNGGHFCLLHLSQSMLSPALPFIGLPGVVLRTPHRPLSGDEMTAIAAGQMALQAPMAAQFAGGFVVGHSGWPTDGQYANGDPGPGDAHLCVVLDQSAASWFLSIVTGQHHKPKPPFPSRRWNAWRRAHHKSLISYKRHHKLTPIAGKWRHKAKRCAGVTGKEHWYRKRHYIRQSFVHCYAYEWPHAKGAPVKLVPRH